MDFTITFHSESIEKRIKMIGLEYIIYMFYIHVHIQQQVLFNAVIEAILMSFYEELFELYSSLVINTATIIIY